MEWLSIVSPIVNRVLDFIPNPAEKAKAEAEIRAQLMQAAITESQNQSDINKIEAANPNIFISGWRPAIGWICAAGFAWQFLFFPVLSWVMDVSGYIAPLPAIGSDMLMSLTMALLGLGSFRSFEKWKGVSK